MKDIFSIPHCGLPIAAISAMLTMGSLNAFQATPLLAPEPTVVTARVSGGSFLGVGVSEINAERAKALNLREERGVEITRLEEDAPAAKAGIKVNDVVLDYAGQPVQGTEQFVRLVRETPAGREVKLNISRNGALQTIIVKTGERKAFIARSGNGFRFDMPGMDIHIPDIHLPDMPNTYMSWRNGYLGIEAETLNDQLAQYFGVKSGVLVRSVIKGSAAEKAGIHAGDVITKVDATSIARPGEITSAIRAARAKKNASIVLMRDKREMTLNVTFEDDHTQGEKAQQTQPRRAIRVSSPQEFD
jgi:serine protease Do